VRRQVLGVGGSVFGADRAAGRATWVPSTGLLIALLVTICPARGAETPFEPGKDGWLTVFDGSDAAKWTPAEGADWALKDGLLTGSKGEIASYWHWTDFELVALCRGSGAIRCRASSKTMPAQPGYWLDVADGTLRAAEGRVVAKGNASKSDAWREVRLVASKGTFKVALDGKPVAEGADAACPAMGLVALVADGSPFQLKLLRIRPLNREEYINVPSPDTACFVCHANFEKEKISREHREGKNLDEKEEDHLRPPKERPKQSSGCAGCHGPSLDHRSDEDNVTTPDVMYTRSEVAPTCLRCHIRHKAETKRKDGAGAPPPNATCTDCHGKHTASN